MNTVLVNLDGRQINVVIEGGGIGAASSIAVAEAEAAAALAVAAAAEAEAAAIEATGILAAAALKANNLSDLTSASTALTNLGGTAVGKAVFTAANAAAARTTLELGALSTVTPGTGIATALAVNVGSAGAPVLFNGAGGAPSSLTLTNATNLPISTGVSGLGTGVATALGVNVGSAGAFLTSTEVAASGGSSLVAFINGLTGGQARTTQSVLREAVRLNDFTGADPTGTSNSYAALVAAIAATPTGGTLCLNGNYRVSPGVTISKTMTISGQDHRVGNVTSGSDSTAFIYFDTDVADGFVISGAVVTFDGVVVSGIGHAISTGNGIRTTGANNSLVLMGQSVVQSFKKGVVLSGGYYNRLLDASVVFCQTAIEADNVYNLNIHASMIRPEGSGSRAITLLNGSQVSVFGGSIESFQEFGLVLLSGSGIRLFGTYIESDPNTTTAWNAYVSDGCSIERYGCHVYLTCARDISVEGSGTDDYRIISHNNLIAPEATTRRVDVYSFNATKAGGTVDIRGDVYVDGATVGANNNYINPDYAFIGAPAAGRGQYYTAYPVGHASFGKGYDNTIEVTDFAVAAFSSPKALTVMGWGAADAAGDPVGIRTLYGPNSPYRAVYSNGQWEKIGLRMADIAAPTGGATVDTEARAFCAALRTALRAQGVMLP